MAVQLDPSGKDDKNDIKTHFVTREGVYRILNLSSEEFAVNPARPRPVGYQSNQSSPQVRVSIVSLPSGLLSSTTAAAAGTSNSTSAASTTTTTNCNNAAGGGQQSSNSSGSLVAATSPIAANNCTTTATTATNTLSSVTSGGSGAGGTINNNSNGHPQQDGNGLGGDRICFNIGKELYVYSFKGIRKPADITKPIDKKLYKGTNPSCHDFNAFSATPDGAALLVGFTTGQIQLVQPGRREQGKLYNEERLIDKTKVTCLKWVPGSPNLFLAAHASGCMYLYNEELPSTPVAPSYQPFKCGDGYAVMICKAKTARNPLYKWTFGANEGYCINEMCFSPCGSNLAIVSQDGFLRIFQYNSMELIGVARSYFGGFLCVCWSPDGKYVVVGGEDDLVTIYSMQEKRVVARGQGHRSWVSIVAFDPFTTCYTNWDGPDFSDDENPINDGYHRYTNHHHQQQQHSQQQHQHHNRDDVQKEERRKPPQNNVRDSLAPDKLATSYRLGSVGQDTQLCLWDITDDVLRNTTGPRTRLSSYEPALNGTDESSSASIIKPIAITSVGAASKDQVDATAPTRSAAKLLNCTNVESINSKELISSDTSCKSMNSTSSKASSLVGNCIGNSVGASKDSLANDISTSSTVSSKHSNDVTSTSTLTPATGHGNHHSGHHHHSSSSSSTSAFNTLTQKLSNFSFGSDKGSSNGKSHKSRKFTLSKSSGNHVLGNHLNGNNNSSTETHSTATNSLTKSNKSLSNSTTPSGIMSSSTCSTTMDPIKLIGTAACPRFDDTPVLEPLVCKKISHERLTALIFREDCFITACQDGYIYTWARPGYQADTRYQNMQQHNIPSSPTPQGGTVV